MVRVVASEATLREAARMMDEFRSATRDEELGLDHGGPRCNVGHIPPVGLFNIMESRRLLPEGVGHGVKAEDLGAGINDFGRPRYDGPAPPEGHGVHHYHFRLFALDTEKLSQAPKATVEEIKAATQDHALAAAELVGTYER
jgi:Raf kinase inhibitor-like YbhB/YbcL family protein